MTRPIEARKHPIERLELRTGGDFFKGQMVRNKVAGMNNPPVEWPIYRMKTVANAGRGMTEASLLSPKISNGIKSKLEYPSLFFYQKEKCDDKD